MNELLSGIEAGDFVEFDLITNPVEVYAVELRGEVLNIYFTHHRHNGRWAHPYNLKGQYLGAGVPRDKDEKMPPLSLDITTVIKK